MGLIRILLKFLFILALAGVMIWCVGLLYFVNEIPSRINYERYDDADAIVVLTGGGGRLESGFFLLREGYAGKLFISGVRKGVTLKSLVSTSAISPEEAARILARRDDVILGFAAFSTKTNAEEVSNWLSSNHYNRIYLVTASYHMPRALLEFHAAMPSIIFYSYPVFPEDFKPHQWWKHAVSLRLILTEYNKYLLAGFRILFGL